MIKCGTSARLDPLAMARGQCGLYDPHCTYCTYISPALQERFDIKPILLYLHILQRLVVVMVLLSPISIDLTLEQCSYPYAGFPFIFHNVRNQRHRSDHAKAREFRRGQLSPSSLYLSWRTKHLTQCISQVAALVSAVTKQVQEHEPDTLLYYAFQVEKTKEIVVVER